MKMGNFLKALVVYTAGYFARKGARKGLKNL
jgi:hypothetical protein